MLEQKRLLIIDNLAVESARRQLYRELAKGNELDIHLLVPDAWKETTHTVQCETEGSSLVHIHRTGIIFGFRHHRVMYSHLFRVIRQVRPDAVLAVHAPENYATVQLLIARKFLLPTMKICLFASRNIDLPSVGFPFKLAFLNRFCDWLTGKSQVDVVFHRPRGFGHLYQRYTDKTIYIPHSVDCSMFKRDTPMKRDSAKITIAYVGRLTEVKGIHILIEALSKLPPEAELIILGEGPFRERLQTLAITLGVSHRVRFEPLVPYASIPACLNRFDVVVLPSLETSQWQELFGRILIEAMACEVPVVASSTGGIPEVIGDTGILFQVGSPHDLAEKLLDLLRDDGMRKSIGKKERERALRLFDVAVVAKQLGQGLADLLH